MSRRSMFKAAMLAAVLFGFAGSGSAKAQDWTDYLHWPYTPPTVPGNGFQYNPLYDNYYLYPREMRDRSANSGSLLPQLLRREPEVGDAASGRTPRVVEEEVLLRQPLLPRRFLSPRRPIGASSRT